MPASVTLSILNGPRQGEIFVFDQHTIFVIGRQPDCQLCFSEDRSVSRYHCLLEINPPGAVMRELGSQNGTYINGCQYGGYRKQTPPEIISTELIPEVELQDNDEIRIGTSTLYLTIDQGAEPVQALAEIVSCQRCGQAVANEVATRFPSGAYLCQSCREQQAPSHARNVIPDYEMVKKLGKGGVSDVYLVRNTRTGQLAALKVLRPSRTEVAQHARAQFLREIASTRELEHPHVVGYVDSGEIDDAFYLLVEFCAGGTLSQLLEKRGGTLPLGEAAPLLLGALEGLATIHRRGLIHRDIKPANILLADAQGTLTAKIADMGLAKSFIMAGFSNLTPPGFSSGTVPFMPREQLLDYRFVRPVSDVWSIGATCYYLLTGAYPREHHPGRSGWQVVLEGQSVPIRKRNAQLPLSVAEVIDRSLQLNPADRYRDANEMLQALTQALHCS
ncbi:MAG TPA: FHA domain-containing serine/threonine-protein kinase [Ktedonobacteraceae bacterium]|nr:FHA domain-containing serine/threonine-protein kinase [Ktedonobacteraceae bacterium]